MTNNIKVVADEWHKNTEEVAAVATTGFGKISTIEFVVQIVNADARRGLPVTRLVPDEDTSTAATDHELVLRSLR